MEIKGAMTFAELITEFPILTIIGIVGNIFIYLALIGLVIMIKYSIENKKDNWVILKQNILIVKKFLHKKLGIKLFKGE
jgi:hypothetical protein